MEFFVDNYYEFSDVRQSKYSSFMMIYELYKSHKMCQDCLEINVLDDALVPSLNCQRCSSKHKDDFKITDTALQSVEVIDVFMTNSVETDSSMEQFMLVKNTNKNIVDQLTLEKNNPYLNFNQDEIISHSPFVSIKKLDKEVVSYFLRNTNQIEFTKTKKLINQSKIIKKSSTKQNSARKGKILFKSLLNYVNE